MGTRGNGGILLLVVKGGCSLGGSLGVTHDIGDAFVVEHGGAGEVYGRFGGKMWLGWGSRSDVGH